MRISVLQELLDGSLQATMEQRIPVSEIAQKELEESTEKLTNSFNEEQKELFDQYLFAESGVEEEKENACFKQGFRYGLLLGVEVCDMKTTTQKEQWHKINNFSNETSREKSPLSDEGENIKK
jgi:hypothetical protein